MDDPTQQEEPEDTGEHELNDRYEQPALEKLAESRDEEAAERPYRTFLPSIRVAVDGSLRSARQVG